jgi:hypothetical protein
MVDKAEITQDTKVSEMTVGELKALIREVVSEIVQRAVWELEMNLPDPDAGKEFTPEFAQRLRESIEDKSRLYSIEEVEKALGLDG